MNRPISTEFYLINGSALWGDKWSTDNAEKITLSSQLTHKYTYFRIVKQRSGYFYTRLVNYDMKVDVIQNTHHEKPR